MNDVKTILQQITFHDATLQALIVNGDGSVELHIDFDTVWNKQLNSKGIILKSVYEISNYKIDRLNIIGDVNFIEIDDYDKQFIVNNCSHENDIIMIVIEFVAGGDLTIICSNKAELLK